MKSAFKTLTLLSILIVSAILSFSSKAQQPLGTLELKDLTLRPQGYLKEGKEGEFELGESSAKLSWVLDDHLSSALRFGARQLRGRQSFYTPSTLTQNDLSDLDLLEAYGQFDGVLGRVRLGLIPVEFSREALLQDNELIFPRGQAFTRGVVGLRDFGLNYSIGFNRFYTSVTAHNGESGPNTDNKTWYTARWGYDFRKLRLEAFGQTGHTTPDSTAGSTLQVAKFNPDLNAQFRMGGFFADWVPSNYRVSMEVLIGDVTQEKATNRFISGHIDLGQLDENGLGWFLRYNPFDPDTRTPNDAQHNMSIALVKANASKTSKLILVGTKSIEEGPQKIPNDEIRLIWSATPLYTAPRY